MWPKVWRFNVNTYSILMDAIYSAPSRADIHQQLISEESGDMSTHGQTSWIACGIKIQELQ
jgi:hypothetical protein